MIRGFSAIFCFLFFAFVAPISAMAAQYSFRLDGGYLYSRWEYQSSASTFSLLSKAGTTAGGELTVGGGAFDLVLGAQYGQFSWQAPSSRIITGAKTSALDNYLGLRLKTAAIWTTVKFARKDTLYLVENSITAFDLKKTPANMGVFALTLFGWGQGYKITIDGEIGMPMGTANTDAGDLKFSYYTRGVARVEFGSIFRVGFLVGIENQEYAIDTNDKYYRSDFFGGLTFAIGAGKGKGGGGRSSGSVPNWPL